VTTDGARRTRVLRVRECFDPPVFARREVLTVRPADDAPARPPVLFVPGFGHGAWVYAEHWLEHAADRGFPATAMSPRGHGASGPAPEADLRAYAHDVTQVAAALPRQAVIVGHGAGALVVAMALARYPAKAGVLVAPVFGGLGSALALVRRNPGGTLPALFGGAVRLNERQLFSRELATAAAKEYVGRLGRASGVAQRQLLRRGNPERPVGQPPMLVVGSQDDLVVPLAELESVARRYGGAPLLFPGMGHDAMLDARWREPIDAICDWLEKLP